MYELITSVFKTKYRLPKVLFTTSLGIYNGLRLALKKMPVFPSQQFYSANFEKFDKKAPDNALSFEVIYVATSKDFDVLSISIRRLLRLYKPSEIPRIRIIVPGQDVESCKELIDNLRNLRIEYNLEIVNENECLDAEVFDLIKQKIPHRFGWVLQQFLKLQAALESQQNNVLILDADTILLRKRNFVDQKGLQLLFPTDEYNQDYYQNLIQLFGLQTTSHYSFVSHHLLIQQKVLREIIQESKCTTINEFAGKIFAESDLTSNSPFSIDYELYSQYLLLNFRDNVQLSRWANLSLKRSRRVLKLLDSHFIHVFGFFYYSLSLHSWTE
jgi:hypothetical protein